MRNGEKPTVHKYPVPDISRVLVVVYEKDQAGRTLQKRQRPLNNVSFAHLISAVPDLQSTDFSPLLRDEKVDVHLTHGLITVTPLSEDQAMDVEYLLSGIQEVGGIPPEL
jgi:hypothetical protein